MPKTAIEIFMQSDGEVTKAYYAELEQRGPVGIIAVNLFRAQKTSSRAKVYRGRSFKRASYDVKNWSIGNLCRMLVQHGETVGLLGKWGWKEDPKAPAFKWVLYIDLPDGQVSFHSAERASGPDYLSEWDNTHRSAERILAFCDQVMSREAEAANA